MPSVSGERAVLACPNEPPKSWGHHGQVRFAIHRCNGESVPDLEGFVMATARQNGNFCL
jgi:hypothetical protein